MTTRRPTCARPKCPNLATRRGYCDKHADLTVTPNQPAGPAQDHINHLLNNGWGKTSIARAAGVGTSTINRLAARTTRTIHPDTARRILTVGGTPTPGKHRSAWPYTRRIRSLRAAGWTVKEISDGAGVSIGTVNNLSTTEYGTVLAGVADKINDLWDAHWADPVRPVAIRTGTHGWPTPMMWTNIDDPDEEPIMGEATNTSHVIPTTDTRRGAARLLAHYGTYKAVQAATGIAPSTLARALNGHTRIHITAQLEDRINTAAAEVPDTPGWERRYTPPGKRRRLPVTPERRAVLTAAVTRAGSRAECARQTGVSVNTIKKLCDGETRTFHRLDFRAIRAYAADGVAVGVAA